jgi:hypothetical protein
MIWLSVPFLIASYMCNIRHSEALLIALADNQAFDYRLHFLWRIMCRDSVFLRLIEPTARCSSITNEFRRPNHSLGLNIDYIFL